MSILGRLCKRCAFLIPASRPLSSSSNNQSGQHESEVRKFDTLSSTWWRDEKDPLLLMNSVRVPLVKSLARRIDSGEEEMRLLDVGCGGGYLSEELAKQRFSVTAIDPSKHMIRIAQRHADSFPGELDLEYRSCTVDEVPEQYDLVVASEVVEHVPCVTTFVQQCADRVRPGGGLMFTTINRTLQSWLFALMLAEHVVGLVPPGTHQYHKLVPPQVLIGALSDAGFEVIQVTGLSFNPVTRQWSEISDQSINYAVSALKTS